MQILRKKNKNISFYKNTNEIDLNSAFIFNSVPLLDSKEDKLWQHFKGIEIETKKNVFEIHFPVAFTMLMKLLKIMPNWLYFMITSKGMKKIKL